MTFKSIISVAVTCSALMLSGAAQAAYPSQPIKIIVPYQAGGSTDIVIREFAKLASPLLKTTIIIENKGGAGATMGAREIAKAKPDGYTLAIIPSPVFRLPHIQEAGYDPLADFTYIMMLSGYTLGVAVKSDAPYESWQEFIEAAKASPTGLTYGTASIGSASNVMMEQIAKAYGFKWTHVPYQGESAVIQAVLGHVIDAYAGSSTNLPMVRSGQMRMLVTWGNERSAIYPDTPALKELNPTISPTYAPFGIAGPKSLPPQVFETLSEAFKAVATSPEFEAILHRYGQELVYMDQAEYQSYAKQAFAQEAEIVQSLGLANN